MSDVAIRRAQISDLEAAIKELPDQIDLTQGLKHHHCRGLYARELFMQAGSVWVGKIHKYPCIAIMVKGKIAMVNAEDDGCDKIMEGHHVFVSPAGTKRALVILEDTVWVTVHPTEHTDLAAIEDELIAADFDELDRLEHIE